MRRIMSATFAVAVFILLSPEGQVEAGAGQGIAASRAETPSVSRIAGAGQRRDFDWHNPRPGGNRAYANGGKTPRITVVSGRGSWICSPAGAGADSRCFGR